MAIIRHRANDGVAQPHARPQQVIRHRVVFPVAANFRQARYGGDQQHQRNHARSAFRTRVLSAKMPPARHELFSRRNPQRRCGDQHRREQPTRKIKLPDDEQQRPQNAETAEHREHHLLQAAPLAPPYRREAAARPRAGQRNDGHRGDGSRVKKGHGLEMTGEALQ